MDGEGDEDGSYVVDTGSADPVDDAGAPGKVVKIGWRAKMTEPRPNSAIVDEKERRRTDSKLANH